MTAADAIVATPPLCQTGRLRERLTPVHGEWRAELQSALRVVEDHSDILSRWRAIRYLDSAFLPRFERERRDVEGLGVTLGEGQQERLWAAGELVALSLWQAAHAVGLCHDTATFGRMSGALLRAVEYWFRMVEEIVGPMNWEDVPRGIRQDLASLGAR